jgi:HK97 gp10 family phage protein
VTTRIRITSVVAPAELGRQIAPRMTNLGRAVGARMQRLVPKRTWALHDTITAHEAEVDAGRVSVMVSFGGGDVDYGMHVERGTSRMAAQPFARPAIAQSTGADLLYSGTGPTAHGVVGISTRRQRVRTKRGG